MHKDIVYQEVLQLPVAQACPGYLAWLHILLPLFTSCPQSPSNFSHTSQWSVHGPSFIPGFHPHPGADIR